MVRKRISVRLHSVLVLLFVCVCICFWAMVCFPGIFVYQCGNLWCLCLFSRSCVCIMRVFFLSSLSLSIFPSHLLRSLSFFLSPSLPLSLSTYTCVHGHPGLFLSLVICVCASWVCLKLLFGCWFGAVRLCRRLCALAPGCFVVLIWIFGSWGCWGRCVGSIILYHGRYLVAYWIVPIESHFCLRLCWFHCSWLLLCSWLVGMLTWLEFACLRLGVATLAIMTFSGLLVMAGCGMESDRFCFVLYIIVFP